MIKIFYDLETTGTDVKKHSIHQIAGIIEVNGVEKESFNIKTRPHPKAIYEEAAMQVCKVDEAQLKAYQPMKSAHKELLTLLGKYVDKFNQKQKAHLIGFNNRAFDDIFLRAWFEQNGDQYIGSWFWNDTLDSLVLASEYLLDRRANMPSFKLKRVAKELGLVVDEAAPHDALYDVNLTRSVYRIITGLDFEI